MFSCCGVSRRPGHPTDTLVLDVFPSSSGVTLVLSADSAQKLAWPALEAAAMLKEMPSRLATSLCGVSLTNPVLAASGTYGYGVELKGLVKLEALGGIIVKGLSREPMDGNPPPRLVETAAGMINSVGLQNIGVRAFVRDKLPQLEGAGTAIFANVFGYAVEDYVEVMRVLEDAAGLAGYELNVSCPNTKHGGIFFSSDPSLLGEVVSAVKRMAKRPLI